MQTFQVRVLNSDFVSHGEVDAADVHDARGQALKAALQIGTDEICNGAPFFGAEVHVETDGKLQNRFLVSIGQSPLNMGSVISSIDFAGR